MELASWWATLAQEYDLSPHQIQQFKTYWVELSRAHEDFNITTEIQEKSFVVRHVADSLSLHRLFTPWQIECLADVGSGGGFPGIPLAIAHPETKVILIEVNHKKIQFLEHTAALLGLTNVEVCSLDWRTFLRKTEYPIQVFCARASLSPEELLRLFRPSSAYRESKLVYWASRLHEPTAQEQEYIQDTVSYTLANRQRKLFLYGLTHVS